jgi:hypothetical protein
MRPSAEGFSRTGELHSSGGTDEQERAQVTLEALHPRAQRRLGQEEGLRGAADASPSCHFDEGGDLSKEHVIDFTYRNDSNKRFAA